MLSCPRVGGIRTAFGTGRELSRGEEEFAMHGWQSGLQRREEEFAMREIVQRRGEEFAAREIIPRELNDG